MTLPETRVLVGIFGRAVGLKGELRLKSFTGDPQAIADYAPLTLKDGRAVDILALRPVAGTADMLVARVKGTASREAAEALNRAEIFASRDAMGEAGDDEYFQADLIGLAVRGPDGERIGTVVGMSNYGAGDILDIKPLGGPAAMVPFRDPFVPTVDVAGGYVVISDAELLLPTDPAERGQEGD